MEDITEEADDNNSEKPRVKSFAHHLFIATSEVAKTHKELHNVGTVGYNACRMKHLCYMPTIFFKLGIEHKCDRMIKVSKIVCVQCEQFAIKLRRVNPKIYGFLSNGKPSKLVSTKCIIPHCNNLRDTVRMSIQYQNTPDVLLSGCKDHTCQHCSNYYHYNSTFNFILCLKELNSPLYRMRDLLKIINGYCEREVIIERYTISDTNNLIYKIHRVLDSRRMLGYDYDVRMFDKQLSIMNKNIKNIITGDVNNTNNNDNADPEEPFDFDKFDSLMKQIDKYNTYVTSGQFCPENLPLCKSVPDSDNYINEINTNVGIFPKSKECLTYVNPHMAYLNIHEASKFYLMKSDGLCYPCYRQACVQISKPGNMLVLTPHKITKN